MVRDRGRRVTCGVAVQEGGFRDGAQEVHLQTHLQELSTKCPQECMAGEPQHQVTRQNQTRHDRLCTNIPLQYTVHYYDSTHDRNLPGA